MQKKFNCSDILEVITKIEESCNLKSFTIEKNGDWHHYFEFQNEKEYLMFLLRWSNA